MSSDKATGSKQSRDKPTIPKSFSSKAPRQSTRPRLDSKSKPGSRLGPSALTSHESSGSRPMPASTTAKNTVGKDQGLGLAACDDNHIRLLEWAKNLGFMPNGNFTQTSDYPSDKEMKKLCRRDIVPVWEHLMRCVRPKQEVAAIRGALAERRRLQTADGIDGLAPVSSTHARVDALRSQLGEKKREAAGAEASLEQLMARGESQVLKLETLAYKTELEESKVRLLERKSESLSADVAQTEKYTAITAFLLDSLTRRGAGTGAQAVSSLRECVSLFEGLHRTAYETSAPALSHKNKARLRKATEKTTASLSAPEIFGEMSSVGDELDAQTGEACASLLVREEEDGLSAVTHAELQLHRVEALYVRLAEEAEATEKENARLEAAIEEAFLRCRDLLVEKLQGAADTDPDGSKASSLAEQWLEKKVACTQLESSVSELKRVAREMSGDSERLEQSSLVALGRLQKGAAKERALGHRIAYMIALGNQLTGKVHETVAATLAALGDPALGQTVKRGASLVTRSLGVGGEEVGVFCHLPMEVMDRVELPSGEKTPRSNLLINYVQALPRLVDGSDATGLSTVLGGAPMSSIDDVVCNLHAKRIYFNQLRWALEDREKLITEPVADAGRSDETERETDALTLSLVNALRFQAAKCDEAIQGFQRTFHHYVDHPIQAAIADDRVAGGRTLAEWARRFDEVYEGLEETEETEETRRMSMK